MADPTRLEAGTRHVLAWCHQCPPWRELHGTRPAGLRAAAAHLEAVHGNTKRAAQLRELAGRIDRRHAEP